MKTSGDKKLFWVQHNRYHPRRVRWAGELVDRLAKQVESNDQGLCEKIAALLAEHTGDSFGEHCRLAGIRNGTLVVYVDEPTFVFAMRTRWLSTLHGAVTSAGGRRMVSRIWFEFGGKGRCAEAAG